MVGFTRARLRCLDKCGCNEALASNGDLQVIFGNQRCYFGGQPSMRYDAVGGTFLPETVRKSSFFQDRCDKVDLAVLIVLPVRLANVRIGVTCDD